MDLIERVLHISPDGGSGLTEFAFMALPIFVALAWTLIRFSSKTRRSQENN